jgi:hypothetical protein
MGSIYQAADRAVLWLGPERDYTKEAMDIVHGAEKQKFDKIGIHCSHLT